MTSQVFSKLSAFGSTDMDEFLSVFYSKILIAFKCFNLLGNNEFTKQNVVLYEQKQGLYNLFRLTW